jgi:hypothetical protein
LLRDLIAEHEHVLVEASHQHANLSKEAVHGMALFEKRLRGFVVSSSPSLR